MLEFKNSVQKTRRTFEKKNEKKKITEVLLYCETEGYSRRGMVKSHAENKIAKQS